MCRKAVLRDKLCWFDCELITALLFACCSLFSPKEGAPVLFPLLLALRRAPSLCCRETLTGDGEHVGLDLSFDLEATSPLGVICPAQAGHVGHAAFMDVHHTVWMEEGGETRTNMNMCWQGPTGRSCEEFDVALCALCVTGIRSRIFTFRMLPSVEATANQLPPSTQSSYRYILLLDTSSEYGLSRFISKTSNMQ